MLYKLDSRFGIFEWILQELASDQTILKESIILTVTAASTPPATPPATSETHCGVICWRNSQNQKCVYLEADYKLRGVIKQITFCGASLLALGWTES